MKTINTYINEKLQLTIKQKYTCQPKDWGELQRIIIARIKIEGSDCDLNDIDTSKIIDMSYVFDAGENEIFEDFNVDISMCDVSNVKNMECMFWGCKNFDCDLSKWDVSNVKYMSGMFEGCKKFNQNLNSWDVSNVTNMYHAFDDCPTKPDWYDKDKCK